METSKQVAVSLLRLTDHEFYSQTDNRDLQRKLARMDFIGLAINAPAKIPVAIRSQLPLLLAHRATMLRAWEVTYDLNTCAIAWDEVTQQVRCDKLYRSPKAERSRSKPVFERPPRPDRLEAKSIASRVSKFDIRPSLGLPWVPGTLSLTVISYDWTSNTVQVELVGEPPPSPSEPDEVNPAPDSDLGLPSYVKTHNIPSAPKQGVAFAIDVKPKGRAGMIAKGAFSTVARSVHLPQERQTHRYADGRQHTIAAVVRVSLLLLRLNGEWPYLFNWTLPVYSATKINPGDRLEGHFTIDLLQGRAGVPAAGDYAAYALMEAKIYGPVKFKWIGMGVNQ